MDGVRLVIDTATERTVVAIGHGPGGPVMDASTPGPERAAAILGIRLAGLVAAAAIRPADVRAVGVGVGPGGFTGLRVGLATAKTLAWSLGIPLLGLSTTDALRRAAARAVVGDGDEADMAASLALVIGAGARDHYLVLPGQPPVVAPAGTDVADLVGGAATVTLGVAPGRMAGLRGPGDLTPADAGAAALAGLGPVLLDLLEERLAEARSDDIATLAPAYVAPPRGVGAAAGALVGWTPDLR